MIAGVNIISGKASVSSINGAGGSWGGWCSEPLSRGFRGGGGRAPLRTFLCSKEQDGPGENTATVVYLFMRIHPKSFGAWQSHR